MLPYFRGPVDVVVSEKDGIIKKLCGVEAPDFLRAVSKGDGRIIYGEGRNVRRITKGRSGGYFIIGSPEVRNCISATMGLRHKGLLVSLSGLPVKGRGQKVSFVGLFREDEASVLVILQGGL